MKAIKCLKYGASDNIVLTEAKRPTSKENEVLVEIHATSVSTSDVLIRRMDQPPVLKFILQLNLALECLKIRFWEWCQLEL